MQRRVIYNVLTMTALLAALGTDYLAQAGTCFQADAVITVAEKMAVRFSKAFPQRSSQPATRLESTRQTAVVAQEFFAIGRHDPQQARCCSTFALHLPPPLA
jgi:hypothetical protein